MSVELEALAPEAGADTPPIRPGTDRDPLTGRFAPGNAIARTHGLYASAIARALADERQAFLAASLTDDGGEAEVPTRRRSLHEYRARLHIHICALSDAIERHGLFDRRGRLRVAWLQRVEGLIATAQRIDGTLGLARRAKPVPSLAEALAAVRLPEDDR